MARYPIGYHGWLKQHDESDAEGQGPAKTLGPGDLFPSCRLTVIGGDADREYFGLALDARGLSLADVQAKYVLVVFFNSMCSDCLEEVKVFEKFYEEIQEQRVLRGNVKVFGVGMQDTRRSVNKFRRRHGVKFPLFADEAGEIFDCLGRASVPVAYLLERLQTGEREIVMAREGYIKRGDPFYDQVLRLARGALSSTP